MNKNPPSPDSTSLVPQMEKQKEVGRCNYCGELCNEAVCIQCDQRLLEEKEADLESTQGERLARLEAHESERKTVHEWLNDLGIPKEEFGKPICLLRRLRITCDLFRELEGPLVNCPACGGEHGDKCPVEYGSLHSTQSAPAAVEQETVKRVIIPLCDLCLEGKGEECHTPGCALFLHNSPGHPILKELYEVLEGKEPPDGNALNLQLALKALHEIGENKLRQGDAIWMRNTAQDALDKIRLSSHAPKSASATKFPETREEGDATCPRIMEEQEPSLASSAAPVVQPNSDAAGPPPCVMCGKTPHQDSVGHSYLPTPPSPSLPIIEGEKWTADQHEWQAANRHIRLAGLNPTRIIANDLPLAQARSLVAEHNASLERVKKAHDERGA